MTDQVDLPIPESDEELLRYCQTERVKAARKMLTSDDPKAIAVGLKALDGVSNTVLRREQNKNEQSANDIADRALRVAEQNRRLYAGTGTDNAPTDSRPREVEGRKAMYDQGFQVTEGMDTPVGTSINFEDFTNEQEKKRL